MSDPEIPDRGYTPKDVEQHPVNHTGFLRRHWGKLTISTLVGVPVLFLLVWTVVGLNFTYSSGQRVGYVQKLSKKGWVCKTWEGELQMSNVPGSAPILFEFTVWNDSVARVITDSEGKRVQLDYREHLRAPTSCFGDTRYVIVGLRVLDGQN